MGKASSEPGTGRDPRVRVPGRLQPEKRGRLCEGPRDEAVDSGFGEGDDGRSCSVGRQAGRQAP